MVRSDRNHIPMVFDQCFHLGDLFSLCLDGTGGKLPNLGVCSPPAAVCAQKLARSG